MIAWNDWLFALSIVSFLVIAGNFLTSRIVIRRMKKRSKKP